MDLIALMACYAAGVIAVIFAARNPEAGFLTHCWAWIAGCYLSGLFVATGLTTHALTPFEWTGRAETGPLTLLIMVLSMAAPFIVGWDHHGRNHRH